MKFNMKKRLLVILLVLVLASLLPAQQQTVRLLNTIGADWLRLIWNEADANDRTLSFLVNGANRIIGLSGDFNLSGSNQVASWIATTSIGIGTATVPHGGVGAAMFALDGANASIGAGPHVQFTTVTDDYPLLQIYLNSHDNIQFRFDNYWDGADKSSDVGSNFMMLKVSDQFQIRYDSGIAQGAEITWNNGLILDTSGNVHLGTSNAEFRFYEGANYVGFEAPALGGDQIWVLPNADGNANEVLTTNGIDGTLSWSTKGGGGAATDVYKTIDVPAGANTVASGATDTLFLTSGSANLTITGTALTDTIDFDFDTNPSFGNITVSGTVDGIDIATDVGANTTHRGSVGTDHANVGSNNTHRGSNGTDHANVGSNNAHRGGDGSDHGDVADNTTHRGSNGNDHSNVGLNNTHRGSNGSNHSFLDQSVVEGASVLFEEIGPVGDPDLLQLSAGALVVDGSVTGDSIHGDNVTGGVDPGHTHTIASLSISELLDIISDLQDRVSMLENLVLNKEIR